MLLEIQRFIKVNKTRSATAKTGTRVSCDWRIATWGLTRLASTSLRMLGRILTKTVGWILSCLTYSAEGWWVWWWIDCHLSSSVPCSPIAAPFSGGSFDNLARGPAARNWLTLLVVQASKHPTWWAPSCSLCTRRGPSWHCAQHVSAQRRTIQDFLRHPLGPPIKDFAIIRLVASARNCT